MRHKKTYLVISNSIQLVKWIIFLKKPTWKIRYNSSSSELATFLCVATTKLIKNNIDYYTIESTIDWRLVLAEKQNSCNTHISWKNPTYKENKLLYGNLLLVTTIQLIDTLLEDFFIEKSRPVDPSDWQTSWWYLVAAWCNIRGR